MYVYEAVVWWFDCGSQVLGDPPRLPPTPPARPLPLLVLPSLSPPAKPEGGGQYGRDRIGKTGQGRARRRRPVPHRTPLSKLDEATPSHFGAG